MGGDGMGGLAVAIGIASLCILSLPAILGGALGWLVARKTRLAPLAALLGALLGGGAGVVAVAATFYESSFDPPPSLTIEVPSGLAHETVVLIEDPSGVEIEWGGIDVPFAAPHGRVTSPRSGVVRVRSLGMLDGRGDIRAALSTGALSNGAGALNAPPGLGSGRIAIYVFAPYPGREPDLGMMPPDELTRVLREREAER